MAYIEYIELVAVHAYLELLRINFLWILKSWMSSEVEYYGWVKDNLILIAAMMFIFAHLRLDLKKKRSWSCIIQGETRLKMNASSKTGYIWFNY